MNNVHIERALSHMHQDNLRREVSANRREVSANRSAKWSRTLRRASSSTWGLPGLFSLSLKRA